MEEYERLKEFSENIVESIHVGILAADLDDRVESWNSQIEKLTGISRSEAVGRKLARAVAGRSVRAAGTVARATGRPQHLQVRAAPKARRHGRRTLNIAIAPLVSRDGAHIGRLIIFDDVTDRAELERRLMQADKLSSIGLLAAGVAHEVNTPLAVISTYAQMLAKQISGDAAESSAARKDRAADVPRQRDRQFAAEFLAHLAHGVCRAWI